MRPDRVLVDVALNEVGEMGREVLLDLRDAAEVGGVRDVADAVQLRCHLGVTTWLRTSLAMHPTIAGDICMARLAELVVEGLGSVGPPHIPHLPCVASEDAPPRKKARRDSRVVLEKRGPAIALLLHDLADVPGSDYGKSHHTFLCVWLLKQAGHHIERLAHTAVRSMGDQVIVVVLRIDKLIRRLAKVRDVRKRLVICCFLNGNAPLLVQGGLGTAGQNVVSQRVLLPVPAVPGRNFF
mmetsp:Transcript_80660/g.233911  ORF Transcript_80660/g.233911 Transcript_80660/m.233911 type:complete len:239 (-) Transcript_80660:1271-1987(-)